jgi:lipoprotein-releasing system ATP-binding protein
MLDGQDVSSLGEAPLARLRSRVVGFVFQLHHLLPQCSILENVLVPTLVARGQDGAPARARSLLERVGLGQRLSHRPGQLSGGECQRAAVVRALINRPQLVLADEPTGSLDRASAESLATLLGELNREEGVALITVTHSADLAAKAGKVLELRDGRLAPR